MEMNVIGSLDKDPMGFLCFGVMIHRIYVHILNFVYLQYIIYIYGYAHTNGDAVNGCFLTSRIQTSERRR